MWMMSGGTLCHSWYIYVCINSCRSNMVKPHCTVTEKHTQSRQLDAYSINSCFIGGGNKSTWRKQQVTDNFITQYCNGYTSSWAGFELTTLVVIDTDCTGSCKSNYHTITTMTASCLDQVTSAWMQWQAYQKIHMLWLWPAFVNWFPVDLLINKTNNCLSIEENQYDDNYSINYVELVEWRLWCLMPLSTIFWLYRGCQFY
jgi:hypothetical protein